MPELGVNVDHIATLRQARKAAYPDPAQAAVICELAGAHQITVHLREDRRHIQDRDVILLRQMLNIRLNLEMASSIEMVKNALTFKPDSVTLVPERREELTTEGGLEVELHKDNLKKVIGMLKDADLKVVLFVDPDLDQIKASHLIDADGIEIHTGKFSTAFDRFGERSRNQLSAELKLIEDAIRLAEKLELWVAAGHGLNYENISALSRIRGIREYNIGHAIVARASLVGLDAAVRDMLRLIDNRP